MIRSFLTALRRGPKFRAACERYTSAKEAYARAKARGDTRAMHAAGEVLRETAPIFLRGHA